jgi:hypothetical protein
MNSFRETAGAEECTGICLKSTFKGSQSIPFVLVDADEEGGLVDAALLIADGD